MPPFGKIANGVTILPSVRLANVLTGGSQRETGPCKKIDFFFPIVIVGGRFL